MREWQPHTPGDPTYTPLEHSLNSNETMHLAGNASRIPPGALLPVGLFMPDARVDKAVEQSEAYSVRLANEGVGWVAVAGEGAVNVIGHTRLE